MFSIYTKLPPKLKEKLKILLNTSGHNQSVLNLIKAHYHARNAKSLEKSIIELTNCFKSSNIDTIEDLTCMDFGAGYVLTDSLALYILGAKKIYSIDYTRLFRYSAFMSLIKHSDLEKIHEIAIEFCEPNDLSLRLNKLKTLNKKNNLESELNIHYIAPYDYSNNIINNEIDLIHSTSVFEHISRDAISRILDNLALSLSEKGKIITKIHLEDHLDFQNNPFEFFSKDTDYIYEENFDSRGNRLLLGDWLNIFNNSTLLKTQLTYKNIRTELSVPKDLNKKYSNIKYEDLYISNAWFLSKKK